ncbi:MULTISPECIES: amidohydrolase family protein [unclassified Polaribacter]|uniref:amidohydrolase family protein n=1 Tax=unclassified Polaribacter TaxID=196858 RepID=UPI0011BD6EE2|nr:MULTISPECIES: amidohydrolase family protein [unclassified Polaribacter]TXD53071.1 amidohydrolase family protein [Polaribacter sp. IC063]TXD59020.1 amidohydrolase family protein [Polaribacter sp. IC066]
MKQSKLLLFSILFSICPYVNFGQELAEQVTTFVSVKETIVAIKNVTIIDGTGGDVKYNQDILLRNNKIASIVKTGTKNYPNSTKIIDGTGKTVIPGLIMLHEHLFHAKPFEGNFKATHMTNTFPQLYLAGGVTTMRTAGSIEANTDLNIKNLIDQGKMVGPSMDVSTPHVERLGFVPQLQSLYGDESIENWLNYWFDKGITSVKVYNNISKDDLREIIKFSHAKNIKVTGHLCSITYREAAELGIDNLEHSFMASTDFVGNKKENECVFGEPSLAGLNDNDPKLIALMQLLIDKNVTLTYTPNVFEPFTNREVIPGGGSVALAPYLLEQMQTFYQQQINSKRDSLGLISFKKEMKRVKKFHAMGGKITVGTDPTGTGKTIAGYSNQRLIELLIETGFGIEEAIKLSTLNGATYLGIASKTGTIEVGKEADLVLLLGDLSKDVSNIRNMEIVFKNGIGFDSKKIFDSVKGKVGLH